jgi:heme iron utilization protein
MSTEAVGERLQALRESLEKNPRSVLEDVAVENSISTREAIECLPPQYWTAVDGSSFEAIMSDLTAWGEVTLLVHTADAILECKGKIPSGRFVRGFYNLEGGVIGGHIRAGNCAAIYFIRRPFMKLDSCAVWFINCNGEPMFKVFVGRNPDRSLKVEQVAGFLALRERLQATASP